MKIQIELSKDVDYPSDKLGKYIWNLEESTIMLLICDSIGECFEEIIRYGSVAELVDAPDLKSVELIPWGSSPPNSIGKEYPKTLRRKSAFPQKLNIRKRNSMSMVSAY